MGYMLDPNANLDFSFDWTAWLATNETITAQTVTATPGATVNTVSQTAGIVTYWLTAGNNGSTVTVTCHITTSAGRQDDRSVSVVVRQR